MVLEELFKVKLVQHRRYLAFFFGFIYTFVGYLIAKVFFANAISVAMLFLCTLLLIPTLMKLLSIEERLERKEGVKHFFHNHKDIFETYLFTFLGVFVAYVALGFMIMGNPESFAHAFEFQLNFLNAQEGVTPAAITNFLENLNTPTAGHLFSLMASNLLVVFLCFLLSFLYGASAIFLIMLNASVFSTFVLLVAEYLTATVSRTILVMSLLLIHLIPEVSGFLLAAIAGGVLSKAFMKENVKSKAFKNVVKDATFMLLISCCLIILAAILEAYVTTALFHSFF